MRFPTHAPARLVSSARGLLALTLALLATLGAVSPGPASASHYVVDLNGGGDFTTIQAAVDAQAVEFRDSILVMPGAYDEVLTLPPPGQGSLTLVGLEGPGSTLVQTIQAGDIPDGYGWADLEGLTFMEAVSLSGTALQGVSFRKCAFRGEVQLGREGDSSTPRLSECDFFSRTRLQALYGTVRGLHFHGAPLYVTHNVGGTMYMVDCTFEGPADTLVYMPWAAESDPGFFSRCTFSGATNGLVYGGGAAGGFAVSECAFNDLRNTAIFFEDSLEWGANYPFPLDVVGSRFERCGTAVRWIGHVSSGIAGASQLARDTILASTRNGIVLGPGSLMHITDCLIEGSGGPGAIVQQTQNPTGPYDANQLLSAVTVSRSKFRHNRGDGLVIIDQDTLPEDPSNEYWWSYWWPTYAANWVPQSVDSCLFEDNGGAGLRILAPNWRVTHSLALGNGGDGFVLGCPDEGLPNSVTSNTSVLNQGTGIRVSGGSSPDDSVTNIRQNLAAMNSGAGFSVPHRAVGSLAFNDAYQNYMGQYVGPASPADSNLTVDPRFCDLSAGLAGLGLQQGSPCGPSGVYGLIGARGEECANVTAVPRSAPSGTLAFSIRPSVARGSVEFVPPAGGGEGRAEVYDLAGRVVWRAPLGGATGSVRWNGEGERGRVRAGLYWVRFTRGAESATQRLVWLE
jgi:hypothetical protein